MRGGLPKMVSQALKSGTTGGLVLFGASTPWDILTVSVLAQYIDIHTLCCRRCFMMSQRGGHPKDQPPPARESPEWWGVTSQISSPEVPHPVDREIPGFPAFFCGWLSHERLRAFITGSYHHVIYHVMSVLRPCTMRHTPYLWPLLRPLPPPWCSIGDLPPEEQLCSRCFYFNALAPALALSAEGRSPEPQEEVGADGGWDGPICEWLIIYGGHCSIVIGYVYLDMLSLFVC